MQTTSHIRNAFLDFFKENDHTIFPSSPLVPYNDSSLLFANSGMVQFKDVFRGQDVLKDKAGNIITKATTAQKCIRAGGKHNDLENVGFTARHHTFFEMLGNFSFGDYFKEQAIYFAWQFLTKTLNIPKEKLYVTVFHTDSESFKLWQKIAGFKEDRIIKMTTDDNFWSMGDVGPCGYNSEIFYDHGSKVKGGLPGTKDADGDRYTEIWNLVFMEFDQVSKEKRIALPKKSVDTGMGLERTAAVMQGVFNNYDTDIFKSLISSAKDIFRNKSGNLESSYKVIADHIRSISFLIADGVLPSNEGRGYVLRRIIRRATRHANILGSKTENLYKLVPQVINVMGEHYGELKKAQNLIEETLKYEEAKFIDTLENGLKILNKETAPLKNGAILNGEFAFKLYDTYGFPLDLTADILKPQNIKIDYAGFEKALEKQRENSKSDSFVNSATKPYIQDIVKNITATEFLGYNALSAKANVLAIIQDETLVKVANEGDKIVIILNQTPFYGESGGQAGDKGVLESNACNIEIYDTKKLLDKFHLHFGVIKSGKLHVKDEVKASVNAQRRNSIKKNHTATHLLHAALHKVASENAIQKGSLVEENYLRFDFALNKALTKEEIETIETLVNNAILQNLPATIDLLEKEKAIEKGAKALFGEKYGSEVRVLTVGDTEQNVSIELCGGTHVTATGEIGFFKILKEGSIASGIRRIEAVTGNEALKLVQEKFSILNEISSTLNAKDNQLKERLQKLLDDNANLQKQVLNLQIKTALSSIEKLAKEDGKIIYASLKDVASENIVQQAALTYAQQNKESLIIIKNSYAEKNTIVIAGLNFDLKGDILNTVKQNFVPKAWAGKGFIGGVIEADFDIKDLIKNIHELTS